MGRRAQDPKVTGEEPDEKERDGEEVRQPCPPVALTESSS